MLNFSVTIEPGVPIYEQIVYAVKKAVTSGQLCPGDPFPSVRTISRELRINPNTAQKAATQLVREGLLEIKPGIGSVVAAPQAGDQQQVAGLLEHDLEKIVVEAKQLGISKSQLWQHLERHWKHDRKRGA